MTWKCGECGRIEGGEDQEDGRTVTFEVDAVCHHCGMPLCNFSSEGRACQQWLPDPALVSTSHRHACHCRSCASRFHSQSSTVAPRHAMAEGGGR